MRCKSYSNFFSKKFQHICVSLDVNFNESLTNDVVSFEQLGPGIIKYVCIVYPHALKKAIGTLLTPQSVCPSVCLSRYLLQNHLAEFYQICYISSTYSKGVREQYYFSMCPSVRASGVRPLSFTLSPPTQFGGIQPNLLHHIPSW